MERTDMTWTKEIPTERGLYWVRRREGAGRYRLVGVAQVSTGPKGGVRPMRWLCPPHRRLGSVDYLGVEWMRVQDVEV